MRDIVVIGGSTGSGAVLRGLVGQLPADLPAAVLITTHIPAHVPSHLVDLLAARTPLPVSWATDGGPITPGHIYVAPPNHHLVLMEHGMRLGDGPRENMVRPAVDPLFRSAAYAFRERVVGVILTGRLNDGAAGLAAVKQCGGCTVVQHPLDSEAEEMPRAAMEATQVDYTSAASELGLLIDRLTREETSPHTDPCPNSMELETVIALGDWVGSRGLAKFAEPSLLSCPHCHGVLSEVKAEGPLRYRCQTGHAFTAQAAIVAQQAEIDEALRIAMRVMEERFNLVSRMAKEARAQGRSAVAELYEARAVEYDGYARTLREAATLALQTSRGFPPEV
jgi:two-component system chemotaxis response regulator CheB